MRLRALWEEGSAFQLAGSWRQSESLVQKPAAAVSGGRVGQRRHYCFVCHLAGAIAHGTAIRTDAAFVHQIRPYAHALLSQRRATRPARAAGRRTWAYPGPPESAGWREFPARRRSARPPTAMIARHWVDAGRPDRHHHTRNTPLAPAGDWSTRRPAPGPGSQRRRQERTWTCPCGRCTWCTGYPARRPAAPPPGA